VDTSILLMDKFVHQGPNNPKKLTMDIFDDDANIRQLDLRLDCENEKSLGYHSGF